MPTLIRKNGMKMAFPTNSMRFISDDVEGISLLSDRPVRKAPMMPSIPASSASTAPRKTRARTKMYCETLSFTRLKNHRVMTGNRKMTMQPNRRMETPSWAQKWGSTSPVAIPTMMASTRSESVSVMMVPPTATVTALFFVIPYLLIMG